MIEKIYIPTLNRSELQITWESMPTFVQDITTLVVQPHEKNLHGDKPILVLPEDNYGITKTRKWIYDHAGDIEYGVFDDDLKFIDRNPGYGIELSKEDADKCMLLMHTAPVDENGTDLPELVENLCPNYDVVFSHAKLEREQLNWLYNMSDCSILISSNEGFGLMGAESLMTGTPLVVNVSGGMQDYCGFKQKVATEWDSDGITTKEEWKYLTHEDYTPEWGSNHDGRYKDHGEWVFPVYPASRSIQGSPTTPYIADDRPAIEDVAEQIKLAWSDRGTILKSKGLSGHQFVKNPEFGFTASDMSRRFIHDIEKVNKKFKPASRISVSNLTEWEPIKPKYNGLSLTREI